MAGIQVPVDPATLKVWPWVYRNTAEAGSGGKGADIVGPANFHPKLQARLGGLLHAPPTSTDPITLSHFLCAWHCDIILFVYLFIIFLTITHFHPGI